MDRRFLINLLGHIQLKLFLIHMHIWSDCSLNYIVNYNFILWYITRWIIIINLINYVGWTLSLLRCCAINIPDNFKTNNKVANFSLLCSRYSIEYNPLNQTPLLLFSLVPLFFPPSQTLRLRAGHFRYFLILSIIKNDFLPFLIKFITYLQQSYLKSPLPVKLTW